MAKATASGKTNGTKKASTKKSSTAKRASNRSSQNRAQSSAAKREAQEHQALIDDDSRHRIIGIVFIIFACVLGVIVMMPSDAIVSSFIATSLKRLVGIGAYLLPILFAAIGIAFIIRFEAERVPARVGVGLAVIYLGILVLMALATPNVMDGNTVNVQVLFSYQALASQGGYIGAGIAWAGLTTLGMAPSCIVAVGLIAIGLVVIGFSVRKLIDKIIAKREQIRQQEEEERGVREPLIDQGPYVPATIGSRRRAGNSDPTLLIPGSETAPLSPRSSLEPEPEPAGITQAITRKLGRPKDDGAESAKDIGSAVTIALEPKQQKLATSSEYKLPSMSLLKYSKPKKQSRASQDNLDLRAGILQQTLEDFGVLATVVDWISGPTVTLFEVKLTSGVRVSRITQLSDDIALAMAAPGVRIFSPIPGTNYVGIEVPNVQREDVLLGDVLREAKGGPLEMAIGKDVEGNAIICDLAKMPHLLIGGTTGSGKTVGVNSMIMSILMRATPDQVRFIMIDPKRVEFAGYDGIPHMYVPVVTEPKEAASALAWGVAEMERRLKLFSKAGVRNIGGYNELAHADQLEDGGTALPFIVIVIDELADLMMNVGKEVEFSISRIAQLARAAGIHLIIATQRPSANVVTGLIKANITNRIAFNVASGLDSRVILDTNGAESLIGHGDLLLSKPEYAKPLRIQGCFTSDAEIAAVVDFLKKQGEPEYHSEILKTNLITLGDSKPDGSGGSVDADDPLLWEAAEIVVASGLGSTSNIQRKLKVGYSRAGRIMDMLEEKGVVGPANGSKPREVLLDAMELESLKALELSDGPSPTD